MTVAAQTSGASGDTDQTTGESPGSIASVLSAIAVLKALPTDGSAIGVNQLARQLGLHKSKVSRLLSTLERHDFIERDPQNGRARLGPGLIALASPLLGRLDVATAARPVLKAIAEETGETALIALWCGSEATMVEQTIGTRAVVHHSWPGKAVSAHSTAAGKVFLAFLPRAAVARVFKGELRRCTPYTLTDRAALEADLALSVQRGYTLNNQENEVDSCGIAAPIRNFRGEVVAALTLAMPQQRFDPGPGAMTRAVVRAADQVSRRLGWSP